MPGGATLAVALLIAFACPGSPLARCPAMNARRLFALVVLAASFSAANQASAQCGYGGGWGAYGAWDVGRLYGLLADRVPYYAAFPPVYYSVPVPRTYGYSPFAYPPGTMTPEVEVLAEPLTITNPYFRGTDKTAAGGSAIKSESEQPAADRTTGVRASSAPLVIVNPYFSRPDAVRTRVQTAVLAQ